jgi:hypothetical protein
MGRLRDYWLEALSTCVTAFLVGFVYTVLAGYAAGPTLRLSLQQAAVHQAPIQQATGPVLR